MILRALEPAVMVSGVVVKRFHKLCGGQKTDDSSKEHDHTAGLQGKPEDLFHALHLPGSEVVADQRAHALDDAVSRQIQESLQLVINAKDHYVAV